MSALSPNDPSSFSRPEIAVVRHIDLKLGVNFDDKVLIGSALLHFDILEACDQVILDVNNMSIKSITLENGDPLIYRIEDYVPNFGSKLTVTLPNPKASGSNKELLSTSYENRNTCTSKDSPKNVDVLLKWLSSTDYFSDSKTFDRLKTSLKPVEGTGTCKNCACLQSYEDERRLKTSLKPVEGTDTCKNCACLQSYDDGSNETSQDIKHMCKSCSNIKMKRLDIKKKNKDSTLDFGTTANANQSRNFKSNAFDLIHSNSESSVNTAEKNLSDIFNTISNIEREINKDTKNRNYDVNNVHDIIRDVTSQNNSKNPPIPLTSSEGSNNDQKMTKEIKNSLITEEEFYFKNSVENMNDDKSRILKSTEDFSSKSELIDHRLPMSFWTSAESMDPDDIPTVIKKIERDNLSGESWNQIDEDNRVTVKIDYVTSATAPALLWLEPEQTLGKQYPYLFSQCQPIHARSILPCQDTPAVKFTYAAEVTAPEHFTVLMSALTEKRSRNKSSFRQPVPIPSYLFALAVGSLASKSIGPRTKVWSEKENLNNSAWEFADTERYITQAEKLCGPYQWGQYDLLVLPPSFPYGGMENPCLTFVTPTLLSGDRSQADVVIHEIMHSWTGNLVTNKNFEHFWLNEGFTVFLERKVASSLIADPEEAKKNRDFQSLLGLQELNEAVKLLGPENQLTSLVVNLSNVHPDDAFSTVPYEKGSLFLRHLESIFGIAVFDKFIRKYLKTFARKSLDTKQFKDFLFSYFTPTHTDKLSQVNWDHWFYSPGMPPVIPDFDTSMTKAITDLVDRIRRETYICTPPDVKNFTPHQMIHLLQELLEKPPLPVERLEAMGTAYNLLSNQNTEIRYRWLRLCVKSHNEARLQEVFQFVNSQGRMKYVRPIYRDLYAWESVRQSAINNFFYNERSMMHVSAYTLKKDLRIPETIQI